MTAYLIRRFLTSLVILLGVSFVVFALLHTIYPSPAIDVLGIRTSPLSIAAWNKSHGFDDPFIVQYFHYLNRLAHGNLGYSYKLNQSVVQLFGERWARSAWLSGSALFLAVIIAIPLGIYQAVRRSTAGDNVATTLSFVAYAMPDFFFYLMAVQVLALTFPVFSFQASQSTNIAAVITDWRGMTLPILSVTLLIVAGFSRYMRSTSMDTLAQDYIVAARARGLPERLVLYRHLVRNASLPMLTLIGLSIPALLAGNVVVEDVFNYPGLGLLFFDALGIADYQVLLAWVLVGAALTIAGNLLADIALTVADPRIRLS
jgi:peptide/nickel transport system permease protein